MACKQTANSRSITTPKKLKPSPVNEMNVKKTYPAENAVGYIAEFTVELVDLVLVDAPTPTVGRLAMKAVLRAAFCNDQTQLQEPLVFLVCEQLYPEGDRQCTG